MVDSSDVQLAQAWDQFCDCLKTAKEIVFRKSAPTAGWERAAGIRLLARNISLALDTAYENADPLHPELTHIMDWRRKQGGDNPDSLYLVAPLNGSDTYRLSGARGSVKFIAFTLGEKGDTPWGGGAVASLFDHTMHVEPDGRFEIILSPEPPEPKPKNWMRTTPKTYRLLPLDRRGQRAATQDRTREAGRSVQTSAAIGAAHRRRRPAGAISRPASRHHEAVCRLLNLIDLEGEIYE